MGKTIKKCKAKNPTLSLYLLSALPCLALSCPVLPIPVVRSCVSLGSSVFCLYWSVPSISAYLWSLCLVGFRRVSLCPSIRCCCPLCLSVPLRCFAPLFSLVFYVGFPLWRLPSLPGLFFGRWWVDLVVVLCGSALVWRCCCRGLPCGRFGVWWLVLLWFML